MRHIAVWLAGITILAAASVSLATAPATPATTTTPTTASKIEVPAGEGARPGAAAPAEEHKTSPVEAELNLGTFVVTILIFLALFAVLSKTAWKPIQTGLLNREKAIRDSIEAAKKAKDDADRTTRDLEAKMAEMQRQAAQQMTQAKADAQKVADSIRTQAEAESAALKDRTLRDIQAAKQQAITEINGYAAELGTAVARKILQRNVTADDQQKLVEESLNEMAKTN